MPPLARDGFQAGGEEDIILNNMIAMFAHVNAEVNAIDDVPEADDGVDEDGVDVILPEVVRALLAASRLLIHLAALLWTI